MTAPTPPAVPPTPPPAGDWVQAWLSVARFAVYLAAAESDRTRALALHEWNAQISSALLHDLAYLEVGLRNAYDIALSARWPGPPHWTLAGETVFAPVYRTGADAASASTTDPGTTCATRSRTPVAREPGQAKSSPS